MWNERPAVYNADVLSVGEFETHHVQKRGLLISYKSPLAAVYPDGFKDPGGSWTDFYDNLIATAYNTTRVKREELPKKNYEDLLTHAWRRRMVLDKNEDCWFANMLHLMGEKKGMEFRQAFGQARSGDTVGPLADHAIVGICPARCGVASFTAGKPISIAISE